MTDPIMLRRRLRGILSALPVERRLSEEMLFVYLKQDFGELKTPELATAITWNQESGFIDYRYSRDEERKEWFLTEAGRQKEGLA